MNEQHYAKQQAKLLFETNPTYRTKKRTEEKPALQKHKTGKPTPKL